MTRVTDQQILSLAKTRIEATRIQNRVDAAVRELLDPRPKSFWKRIPWAFSHMTAYQFVCFAVVSTLGFWLFCIVFLVGGLILVDQVEKLFAG